MLPKSTPCGLTQGVLNSPSNRLRPHMQTVYQGSPLETQCPGFLLEAEHVGILYVPIFQTQKENIFQHKVYCFYKQFRCSELLLLEILLNRSSQMPAKG